MKYTKGWEYRLAEPESVQSGIFLRTPVETDWARLDMDGTLTLKKGFCWNGTNVLPDFVSMQTPSAFHDCLYWFIADGLIPASCRKQADKLIVQMAKERGVSSFAVWGIYLALRKFGGIAAVKPSVVLYAP